MRGPHDTDSGGNVDIQSRASSSAVRLAPLFLVAAAAAIGAAVWLPAQFTSTSERSTPSGQTARQADDDDAILEPPAAAGNPFGPEGVVTALALVDERVGANGLPTAEPDATFAQAPESSKATTALVAGDSVYFDMIMHSSGSDPAAANPPVTVVDDVRLGCGTLRFGINPDCASRLESWRDSVTESKPDVVLIGLSGWDVLDIEIEGRPVPFGSSEHTEIIIDSWQENLEVLTSTGATVLVVSMPCVDPAPDSAEVTHIERFDPQRSIFLNQVTERLVGHYPGDARWLDIRSFTCSSGYYESTVEGTPLYRDGIHLTDEAIPIIWNWLMDRIAAANR